MVFAAHLNLAMKFRSEEILLRNTRKNPHHLVVSGKCERQLHNQTKQHKTKNDDGDEANSGDVLPRSCF